jgi:hypothetical protein
MTLEVSHRPYFWIEVDLRTSVWEDEDPSPQIPTPPPGVNGYIFYELNGDISTCWDIDLL